jgi:hypothetical protein
MTSTRRLVAALALLVTTGLVVVGCGATGSGSSGTSSGDASSAAGDAGGTHTMSDGTTMSDDQMGGMDGMDMAAAIPPSAPARMICSDEIRDAVQHAFDLSTPPAATHRWSARVYTCTYRISGETLALSVKDSPDVGSGRAYYEALRSRVTGETPIRGVESFGFPSFETSDGTVVFLKDGKTLRVDATRLSRAAMPAGFTRVDAAYGVAAAVIGCWTE